MNLIHIFIVCLLSFIVSIFSISVGGTSLITVPLLISLGMVSREAIGTNMFALIFFSLSGVVGFRKKLRKRDSQMLVFFSVLTICGSLIGANFVLAVDEDALKKVIAIIVGVMSFSFLLKKGFGLQEREVKSTGLRFLGGALLIFILGIYGGFFSGGYVTLTSYVLIWIFGMQFLQVAGVTKIFNVFSSLVASAFFYFHNLIDFSVGIPLALAMSFGGIIGAKIAVQKGSLWVRNLFILVALILVVKLLFF